MLLLNKKTASFLIGILLIFSSCSISTENNEPNNPQSGNLGSVNLILPSKFNFDLPIEFKENNSRAYVFAEKVVITFTNESKIYKDEFNKNLASYNEDEGSKIYQKMSMEAGTYSAKVEVFNNNVSAETPVLHGEAKNIVVEKGQTQDLNIILEPVNPAVITFGEQVDVGDIKVTTVEAFGTFYEEPTFTYEIGEEKWYKFTAQGDYTKLDFLKDDNNKYASFAIFNTNGERISFYDDFIYKTVKDEVYYIVAAKMVYGENLLKLSGINQGTDFNRSFTISNVTITDDTDSDLNPTQLTVGEAYSTEYNGLNDTDFFTVDLEANKMYLINIPPNTYYHIQGSTQGEYGTSDGDTSYYITTSAETITIDFTFGHFYTSQNLATNVIVSEANLQPIELTLFKTDFEGYIIPDIIDSIDVKLVRDLDGSRSIISEKSVNLNNNEYKYKVDLGILENWDNASIVIGYKDINGNYIGGETFSVDYYIDEEINYYYLDHIFVEDEVLNTFLNQPTYVSYTCFNYNGSQYILNKVSDLESSFTFVNKPAESLLTDANITKSEFGNQLSFTPDVAGEYVIKGVFKDLIYEESAIYTINVYDADKGGINVNFE